MRIEGEVKSAMEDIPILRWMASDRPTAKNLAKDSLGRIVVDVTKPHILEDMDFFRGPALHFQKYGTYTHLMPNPHPASDYMTYWREEFRRCIDGYIREDGEWIPGYYYWYLNYSPILLTVEHEDQIGGSRIKRAERKIDFPHMWDSDYLYFHYLDQAERSGLHGAVLKTRGRGYSLKAASMMTRNFFLIPESKSYALAAEGQYLEGDALLDKTWAIMSFVDEHTPWIKAKDLKNTTQHKQASYRDHKTGAIKGYKSEIMGVTLKNQPERARGKRGKVMMFEEAGKFPYLLKAWSIARPSMEDGNYTFGTMIAFGTGGTEGADFDGIRLLFSQPKGYRVYGIRNVFDRKGGNTDSGWYCGEYFNRKGFYDRNGNSDVVGALTEIFEEREIVRSATTDPNAMIQEKADRSITPQEAMMKREGNLFPVEDIKAHSAEVDLNPRKWTDANWKVELVIKDGVVDYKLSEGYPIRVFPIRDNKGFEGCIEIREHPSDAGGQIPFGLYIAGIDPYDDDTSTTVSLGSIVIMHRLTGRIVAEYTGRPATAEQFYENCYRLMKYYNAVGNYENNKKGLFGYFDKKNALYMLCDTPQILKDTQMTKIQGSGNTAKGTNASANVNAWGRSLLKSWLLAPAFGGEDDVLNLHTLWSPAMMLELTNFHPEVGNYDRISALGMLMILKEDMHRIDSSKSESEVEKGILAFRPSMRRKSHKQNANNSSMPYVPIHKRVKF